MFERVEADDFASAAAERLAEAETSAYNDQRKAQHNANALNAYHSQVYGPGTEYVLCQCMAQLMAALVGVLSESLTESIKGFYKLRKAYIALERIMQIEEQYLLNRAKGQGDSSASVPIPTPQPEGNGSNASKKSPRPKDSAAGDNPQNALESTAEPEEQLLERLPSLNPDSDVFSHPVDAFIHSGTNLCFGLLLLLISTVPPAFNKLLYIVGFKGDRSRGLRLLWQASKFHSLTGAIAALALLAFYNGFVRCCDILPDPTSEDEEEDVDGYPIQRLTDLLDDMRTRFPLSKLWLLEQSRMEGANRRVDVAMELLCGAEKSPLKQVEALHVFEKSIDAMYLHKYELCAQYFLEVWKLTPFLSNP